MNKIIFDVKEVAKYLRCSESCIRRLKQESKIPYFRIAKKVLFDKDMIDEWIRQNQIMSIDEITGEVKVYE